jgi:HTH-type transcriptional regulator/antitoxin HigA
MNTVTETPIAANAGLDIKVYGRLLARFTPKVIETEAENEAALAAAELLMAKGDNGRSAEEDALLALLSGLIEQFEASHYKLDAADPRDVLAYLMERNDLRPTDLAGIFGSRGKVSEALSGKRSISKEQAKRLGERFRISPAAFI